MYAHDLMTWLHKWIGPRGAFDETLKRFETLRGYGLLPRGRKNAGVRLSDEQIASAVLGFAHPRPGYAGLASLIFGDLRPVGGVEASFFGEPNLRGAVTRLVRECNGDFELLRLTTSVEKQFVRDDYTAVLHFRENSNSGTVSFVTKYATSLQVSGAEENYQHDRLDKPTAIQRSFGSSFFRELARSVSTSRRLNQPLKTSGREYETEEELAEFHRSLGARPSSMFMNLRVDAQVTWPKEPTRMEFGGHHLVLFPSSKDHSKSVSIDLAHEKISEANARTLINRMLSVMSWCDDQPASLHEGWSGNPVPVPVPKQDLGSATTHDWLFFRTPPEEVDLRRCLAYYRDGLNAYSVGLASHAVVSFFRVFETKYDQKSKVEKWVDSVFEPMKASLREDEWREFEDDRRSKGVDPGTYVYKNCRVAAAHGARDVPSDPDAAEETSRLFRGARVIQKLARLFIQQEYGYSDTYLSDDPGEFRG